MLNEELPAAYDLMEPENKIQIVPFEFHGKGSEYFKIWIVNVFLSIITLGIYSAWAKVRNKQYFYGNTLLAGSSFEYTGNPKKILLGRVIAVSLLGAFTWWSYAYPIHAGLWAYLAYLIVIPWVIVRSLKFNAKNSRFRNIAFSFQGTLPQAYIYFFGWTLIGALFFGIFYPIARKKQMEFIVDHYSYGSRRFSFASSNGEFYVLFFKMIGAVILFSILIGVVSAFVGDFYFLSPEKQLIYSIIILIFSILVISLLIAFYVVQLNNLKFNNSALAFVRFETNWTVFSYFLLVLKNTLFVLLTLGIYVPFAKINTARYKAARTRMIVNGGLDEFIAADEGAASAFGEGVHDIFDFDISY